MREVLKTEISIYLNIDLIFQPSIFLWGTYSKFNIL